MDIPTEEELYELEHQDELDALNDFDHSETDYCDASFYDPACRLKNDICNAVTQKIDRKNSENKFQDFSNDETLVLDSEKLPTKRKLSYPSNDVETDEIEELYRNDTSHIEKRKVVDLSDDEYANFPSSKRKCFDDISNTPSCSYTTENTSHCKSSPTPALQKNTFSARICDIENEAQNCSSKRKVFSSLRPFSSNSSYRDSLALTCHDGRRVYFNLGDEDDDTRKIESYGNRTSSLLSTPISELKKTYFLMEENLKRKRAAKNGSEIASSMDIFPENMNEETSLWVEKYRPVSYMHLLSEEGINRTLLQWLKLWDKIVFGKEKKLKKKPVPDPQKTNKFQKNWGELIQELDDRGRPHHKVAFLCGPPGLGKTTLATIIAKHAGYNVVELNASDDRNPEAFRTSLEASTQMKSVLQEDSRPNCLILDEIDGAPAASINVLLSFIKSVGIPKGAKRKKGDIPLLTRPVICICNDQYSPALKPLKQLALVLNFPSTSASRLVTRLQEISSREGLFAEMAALTLLCEKAGNDIRSCLSTLQFLQRKHREIKVSDLRHIQVGQKDMQKGLFAVWQEVFHFKNKKSFDNVHRTVQAFGDYDKVYIGMFENYLNIKFKHKTIDAIGQGSEWLCFADIIQQQIAERQFFFLLPYLPYPAVAFHLNFAANTFPHVSYPSAFYETKSKGFQLSTTLMGIVKDMVSSLKTFLNSNILLLDMFPFLIEIIKPNLRPVNTQLYSDREKGELRRVIELMLAFNLNYHQERSLDGTYNYQLNPNIEELIRFSDIKPKKILTYSTKQLIAREVEMEQMRKGDSSADKKAEKMAKKAPPKAPKAPEPKVFQKKEIMDKPVLDFFGRQVVVKAKDASESNKDRRDDSVWFQFKEGYSNAVRKTIYIKDLL